MKTNKTDLVLKITEITVIFLAALGAFWVGYQQLQINKLLLEADYSPVLEVASEEDGVRLYNRGNRVVNIEFIRIEPADNSESFTINQKSIFPEEFIVLDFMDAINYYQNTKIPNIDTYFYEIFFTVKTPSENRFYQGLIPIKVFYRDQEISGVDFIGSRSAITIFKLDVNNFLDILK